MPRVDSTPNSSAAIAHLSPHFRDRAQVEGGGRGGAVPTPTHDMAPLHKIPVFFWIWVVRHSSHYRRVKSTAGIVSDSTTEASAKVRAGVGRSEVAHHALQGQQPVWLQFFCRPHIL